jgi:RecA-family ATPase
MAKFCNNFDKLCSELDSAVVYCHHHSKGDQGQKKASDRASGSGVFARDPDALLDMIQLDITGKRRKNIENRMVCDALGQHLDKNQPTWRDRISQDDALIADKIIGIYSDDDTRRIALATREKAEKISGWRIEGVLREFPEMAKSNIMFSYPLHTQDVNGLLDDARAAGEEFHKSREEATENIRDKNNNELLQVYENLHGFANGGAVSIADVAEHIGVAEETIRNRIKRGGKELGLSYNHGMIVKNK